MWGNWSLRTGLHVGALITMNPATGEFDTIGSTLPNADIAPGEVRGGHGWDLKSKGVSFKKTGLGGDVSEGDIEVKANVSWKFKSEKSIASRFGETREPSLVNVVGQLSDQQDWLIEQAKKSDKYTEENGIEQGFCVVTKVIYAQGGINLASESEESDFSMDVSGGMLDGSGSAKAGYDNVESNGTVVTTTWPEYPNEYSDEERVVAFEVATFTGKDIDIIPNWNRNLDCLTVEVRNVEGSLIIYAKLIYEVDGDEKVIKMDNDWGISVWSSAQSRIPLNAKNVRVHLTFDDSDGHHYDTRVWSRPLQEWSWGKYILNVKGWVDDPKSWRVDPQWQ